jgi:hypothetical protein
MKMYELRCGEIWGGIRNCDDDITSAGLTTSLYSVASDAGKDGDIYYLSLCDSNALTRMNLADVVGHGEDVSQISQIIYKAIIAFLLILFQRLHMESYLVFIIFTGYLNFFMVNPVCFSYEITGFKLISQGILENNLAYPDTVKFMFKRS